jgi:hypothetical protein
VRAVVALLTCCCAGAFAADVAGPVTGYILDAGRVRPILGIPGAARLGDPVTSGALAVSSIGRLAVTCTDGVVEIVRLSEGSPVRVEGLHTCPDEASLSPSGSAAVLMYKADSRAVILRGLREHPEKAGTVTAGGPCAISDDAELLLCAGESGLVALSNKGELHGTLAARIATFLPASRDAVAADDSNIYFVPGGRELRLVSGFDSASAIAPLAGNRIAVVSAKTRKILSISLDASAAVTLDTPAEPLGLAQLSLGELVHIADAGNGPVWLLVPDSDSMRLMFVPRPETSNE